MSLITVEISSKNRYDILHQALMSIAMQTYKPAKVILFDDSDDEKRIDLRTINIYSNIFKLFDKKNIQWEVRFSPQRGQVKNHIESLELCKTKYIFRMDDDCVAQNDLLEKLLNVIEKDEKNGAVGPYVDHPDINFSENIVSPYMSDVYFKYAIQFHKFDEKVKECEHLYSSFLSRVNIAKNCYPTNISKLGHREEIVFSYKMSKKGYKLLACFDTCLYHMKSNSGGIRTYNSEKDHKMWIEDDLKFREKLNSWGVKLNEYFIICDKGAIGDHLVMKSLLPKIKQKNPNKKLFVGVTFPELFWDINDKDIEIVTCEDIRILVGDLEKYNIYRIGYESNGLLSLENCYRKIYGI